MPEVKQALPKSARLAFLVLLSHSGRQISTNELAEMARVDVRTAERDMHDYLAVSTSLAEMLKKFNSPAPAGVIDAGEAARRLGVSRNQITQRAVARQIGTKIGRSWVFHPDELERLKPHGRGRPSKGAGQ